MPRQQPHRPSRPENVIPFGTYHTAMTQPILAQIRDYWEELRAGRLMPLRSEVDPRDMSSFLEMCFVLERSALSDPRFRLAGMSINDMMGMEVRGMPLRSIIVPDARAAFDIQIDAVFDTPEIQEYKLISDPGSAPRLTGNLLVLPLKGEGEETNRAIGCLVTEGVIGPKPRRFRVSQLQRTSLVSGLVDVDHVSAVPVTGFAETQTPFKSNDTKAYLRVVK